MKDRIVSTVICKCGNDIWEIRGDVLACSNCLAERPYNRRKPSSDISPSQQHAIESIRAYFLNTFGGEKYGLTTDTVEILDFGGEILVKIETGGNVYISEGASICIGPRGKMEVWSVNFATHEGLLKQRLGIK